jgi:hypothetical protein
MYSRVESDGLLFIALGPGYVAMALNAIRSLHSVDATLPVVVVSNLREDSVRLSRFSHNIIRWIAVDVPAQDNRLVKTSGANYSPFRRTMMVDSDVEFVRSPRWAFELLNGFDCAARGRKPYREGSPKRKYFLYDGTPAADSPHWSGSLVLFRAGERSDGFFRVWNDGFRRSGSPFDQISLVEAVRTSGARFRTVQTWSQSGEEADKFILHYAARMPSEVERRCYWIAARCLQGADRRAAFRGIWRRTRRRSIPKPTRHSLH